MIDPQDIDPDPMTTETDRLIERLRRLLPVSWTHEVDPATGEPMYANMQFGEHQTQAMSMMPDDWMTLNELPAVLELLKPMLAERERLLALLNTPEVDDWAKGTVLEAAHQRERWGADHDAGKSPFDWFWLVGYLAQKAAASAVAGNLEKAKHHTISTGAALANWHLSLNGTDTRMRPGVDPERVQNGGAGLSDPPNDTEREQAA
jgi:hypothetical protein